MSLGIVQDNVRNALLSQGQRGMFSLFGLREN